MVNQRYYAKVAFVREDGGVVAVFPDSRLGRKTSEVLTINEEGEEVYRPVEELRRLDPPTTSEAAKIFAVLMHMNYMPVLVEKF